MLCICGDGRMAKRMKEPYLEFGLSNRNGDVIIIVLSQEIKLFKALENIIL